MTTHGLKVGPGPDYPIAYVSDSAPTASGWSTGKKTVDGRLSQGPSTAANVPGVDYETVLEKYKAQGKLIGNITTSEITDATPAAAASHINARACQGPADMADLPDRQEVRRRQGLDRRAARRQQDRRPHGRRQGPLRPGHRRRPDRAGLRAGAPSNYRLVQDAASMNAITSLSGGPVLGLFAPVNMTPMFNPLVAAAAPGIAGGPTTRCTNADRGNQPDLSSMTQKAIALLDNPNGFFLQVESAMVDKQEHASDICGAIGDLVELDEAVQVALDYQETHPDTLIIVTGDHAHSTQIVGGDTDDGKQLAQLQTADGDPMTVAYSTNAVGSDHTGTQIRVAASGPQAANVTGTIDQTDLFLTLLGRTPSTLPGTTPAKPAVAIAAREEDRQGRPQEARRHRRRRGGRGHQGHGPAAEGRQGARHGDARLVRGRRQAQGEDHREADDRGHRHGTGRHEHRRADPQGHLTHPYDGSSRRDTPVAPAAAVQ